MYNKLFTKILDSSIWLESTPTRIVWLTMIAVMDEMGFAQFASVGNVAHRARVTLEEAKDAILTLESPDPASSDPANDGKRLQRLPGGWLVLNAEKHRAIVSRVVVQEQTRARVRKYRSRLKAELQQEKARQSHKGKSRRVTHSNDSDTLSSGRNGTQNQNQNQSTDLLISTSNQVGTEPAEMVAPRPPPPPNGNGSHHTKVLKPADGRSKRPIFSGQRLTVFEWMLDELTKMLGNQTDAFDLHEWFFELDARAAATTMVIPQRDGGRWLLAETLQEARRRGLPIAVTTELMKAGKLEQRIAVMLAEIEQESA